MQIFEGRPSRQKEELVQKGLEVAMCLECLTNS